MSGRMPKSASCRLIGAAVGLPRSGWNGATHGSSASLSTVMPSPTSGFAASAMQTQRSVNSSTERTDGSSKRSTGGDTIPSITVIVSGKSRANASRTSRTCRSTPGACPPIAVDSCRPSTAIV
jgi:hypothetical protein